MGYVLNGQYHEGDPPAAVTAPRRQPLLKQYEIDRTREEFRRDIVQPYVNGKPNREFVEAFPEESKNYFTDEQIKEMERP